MTKEALEELENFAGAVRQFARSVSEQLPAVKQQAEYVELIAGNVRLALADCKICK